MEFFEDVVVEEGEERVLGDMDVVANKLETHIGSSRSLMKTRWASSSKSSFWDAGRWLEPTGEL